MQNKPRFLLLAVFSLLLAAAQPQPVLAAAAPDEIAAGDDDPLDNFNRAMFRFNRTVDGLLFKPAAQIYRGLVPARGQQMVGNFFDNLRTPVMVANYVLQADGENSFISLWRFLINSTIGIGGLFDVASEVGLPERSTDFGLTLAFYGSQHGDYIVLPFIGPSSGRDSLGRLGDLFMDPFTYAFDRPTNVSLAAGKGVRARADNMKLIDDVYETSVDPYTTFRSAYTQRRQSEIRRTLELHRQLPATLVKAH